MTTEWDQLVKRRATTQELNEIRQEIRRAMWRELGFAWSPSGLGDICFSMLRLSQDEIKAFHAEVERRVEVQQERPEPESSGGVDTWAASIRSYLRLVNVERAGPFIPPTAIDWLAEGIVEAITGRRA